MLVELEIRNLGLVESTRLHWSSGLNVLTGETGVGKSTVIRGLKLLGGSKAMATHVRTGARSARIRGVFRVVSERLLARLTESLVEMGLPTPADGELVIERTIARQGSGQVRINGRRTTVTRLRRVTSRLMDIQGQNEHQELLVPAAQRAAIDRFAGLTDEVAAFQRDLAALRTRRTLLRNLEAAGERRREECEALAVLVAEIDAAEVREGEFEALRAERKLLDRSHEIRASLAESHGALYENEGSVIEVVHRWAKRIDSCREALPECGELVDRLEAARNEVSEVGFRLVSLIEKTEIDPARAEEVMDRIELLRGLLTRYGPFEADVLLRCEEARSRLKTMGRDDEAVERLRKEIPPLEATLRERAGAIEVTRRQSGKRLATEIELDLKGLGMVETQFEVGVHPWAPSADLDDSTATAAGRVELRVSANRGEELKPLAAVASGGELARLLLVLRERLADNEGVPVLVFDEIDANVGGRLGGVLGERLQRIAARHQVLSVTHLAQLASFGRSHFKVTKSVVGNRTVTRIDELTAEDRVRELAEMLSGSSQNDLACQQVREMLETAAESAASPRRGRIPCS